MKIKSHTKGMDYITLWETTQRYIYKKRTVVDLV